MRAGKGDERIAKVISSYSAHLARARGHTPHADPSGPPSTPPLPGGAARARAFWKAAFIRIVCPSVQITRRASSRSFCGSLFFFIPLNKTRSRSGLLGESREDMLMSGPDVSARVPLVDAAT